MPSIPNSTINKGSIVTLDKMKCRSSFLQLNVTINRVISSVIGIVAKLPLLKSQSSTTIKSVLSNNTNKIIEAEVMVMPPHNEYVQDLHVI